MTYLSYSSYQAQLAQAAAAMQKSYTDYLDCLIYRQVQTFGIQTLTFNKFRLAHNGTHFVFKERWYCNAHNVRIYE